MFISQSTGKQEVTSYIKKTITLMAWNILVPVLWKIFSIQSTNKNQRGI